MGNDTTKDTKSTKDTSSTSWQSPKQGAIDLSFVLFVSFVVHLAAKLVC